MVTPETAWQPRRWIAATLGFLFQPIGMLYVCRAKLAVIYFVLGMIIAFTEIILQWTTGIVWLRYFSFGWLLMIACSVHSYMIARHWKPVTRRPWYSRWYGLVAFPMMLFILIFSVRAFLYEPFRTSADSMLPSLKIGSHILTQKWGYGNYGTYGVTIMKSAPTSAIQRGDIIVFEFPRNPTIYYVKRVIGLPRDSVKYQSKRLFVNGTAIGTADSISDNNLETIQETLGNVTYKIMNLRTTSSHNVDVTVPDHNYFVLGDNRDHSNDSRYWGFVPEKNIVGKVVFVLE